MNILGGIIGIAAVKSAAQALKNGMEKRKEKERIIDEAVQTADITYELLAQFHQYRFNRGLYVFDDGKLKYKTKPDTVNIGKKVIRIFDFQGNEIGHLESKGGFRS